MYAAFRNRSSGEVLVTGAFHDVSFLPVREGPDALGWEAGFTDAGGRFLDRRRAAEVAGAVHARVGGELGAAAPERRLAP
jgi:hypothetical protein